jgi:hypothetical protein
MYEKKIALSRARVRLKARLARRRTERCVLPLHDQWTRLRWQIGSGLLQFRRPMERAGCEVTGYPLVESFATILAQVSKLQSDSTVGVTPNHVARRGNDPGAIRKHEFYGQVAAGRQEGVA